MQGLWKDKKKYFNKDKSTQFKNDFEDYYYNIVYLGTCPLTIRVMNKKYCYDIKNNIIDVDNTSFIIKKKFLIDYW